MIPADSGRAMREVPVHSAPAPCTLRARGGRFGEVRPPWAGTQVTANPRMRLSGMHPRYVGPSRWRQKRSSRQCPQVLIQMPFKKLLRLADHLVAEYFKVSVHDSSPFRASTTRRDESASTPSRMGKMTQMTQILDESGFVLDASARGWIFFTPRERNVAVTGHL
jgi:hypothetical protein